MKHQHEHPHAHRPAFTSLNRAFLIGIGLNLLFVIAEFIVGFWQDSLGLLSDAGHNLSDVVSLVLAMVAFRLAKVPPTSRYTYGYKKSTILASLLNAVILLVAVGVILAESIEKMIHPRPVEGGVIAWVAGMGVLVNAATAWLFMKDKDKDLNVKGAFLHMAADALVSVGVMVSGIVILHTGWFRIDPIIGLLIAVVIVYSTWSLLRDSIRLSLDGVPNGMELRTVEEIIYTVPGVENVHHLHIWPISTTETALTGHIRVAGPQRMENIKHQIKCQLAAHGISHATLEFETSETLCEEESDLCAVREK